MVPQSQGVPAHASGEGWKEPDPSRDCPSCELQGTGPGSGQPRAPQGLVSFTSARWRGNKVKLSYRGKASLSHSSGAAPNPSLSPTLLLSPDMGCPSAHQDTRDTSSPGYPGQDLLDAHHQLLMLQRVAFDGAVKSGHVEVQSAQCGGLPSACGAEAQLSKASKSPSSLAQPISAADRALNPAAGEDHTTTRPGTKAFGLISALWAQG